MVADDAKMESEQVHDDEGVDRSLVRWMLSLTPTERLRVAEDAIAMVASVARPSDVDGPDFSEQLAKRAPVDLGGKASDLVEDERADRESDLSS